MGSYHFTKYDYPSFDISTCGGHFFRPPGRPRKREALCAETISTLNEALCDFYSWHCGADTPAAGVECPPREAPGDACEDTADNCEAVLVAGGCPDQKKMDALEPDEKKPSYSGCRRSCTGCCGDSSLRCTAWAIAGECEANPSFMRSACAGSCGLCSRRGADEAPEGAEGRGGADGGEDAALDAPLDASLDASLNASLDASLDASLAAGAPPGPEGTKPGAWRTAATANGAVEIAPRDDAAASARAARGTGRPDRRRFTDDSETGSGGGAWAPLMAAAAVCVAGAAVVAGRKRHRRRRGAKHPAMVV